MINLQPNKCVIHKVINVASGSNYHILGNSAKALVKDFTALSHLILENPIP